VTIYTIGHSNVAIDEFTALLKAHAVECLADIRQYPSSRAFPHFNQKPLAEHLAGEGIAYEWFQDLGGRRKGTSQADSPNAGLTSPGFQHYADYMLTPPFHDAIGRLLEIAAQRRTAIMCAEKLYWRCHRMLVSDFLTAQGVAVLHIMDLKAPRMHRLSRMAVVAHGVLTYSAPDLFDAALPLKGCDHRRLTAP
jgi:uncharacterized protein (DUF488 family)